MTRSACALISLLAVAACESPIEPVVPDLDESALTTARAAEAADVILKNGNMDDTTAWRFHSPSGFGVGYDQGGGVGGSRAVKLTGNGSSAAGTFAFLGQSMAVGDLTDRKLTLTARLRLVDVRGEGVAIAIRGDDPKVGAGSAEAFSTTQGRATIRGTVDWTGVSVSLEGCQPATGCLDDKIGMITVYVILLPGTTGSVFVDDVTLSSSLAVPQLALQNGGFEAGALIPDYWWRGGTTLAGYTLEWLRLGAYEGSRAVRITRRDASETDFAYWAQTLRADAFRDGPVTLRARVRTELVGQGVSIAIRGDGTRVPDGAAEAFASTQSRTPITGSSGWVEWSIRLDRLPATMQSLTIYLIFLPKTTGTVDFDGVVLSR